LKLSRTPTTFSAEVKKPYGFDGYTFKADGDDENAVVETDNGQWIVAQVDAKPDFVDEDADDAPWSAITMAKFLTDAGNAHLEASQPVPRSDGLRELESTEFMNNQKHGEG
jgi:hypothetical protein